MLVVLDQRANSSCATGRFELIYRGTTNPNTKGCDSKFVVEGQRINKADLQRYVTIDRKMMKQQEQTASKETRDDVTVTSSSSTRHCCNISLVQLTESRGDPVDSELVSGGGGAGAETGNHSHEPTHNVTAPTSTSASHAHERTASSSNKAYRGLRHTTVQIYSGR